MYGLIRKNLCLWGYGKAAALFLGCLIFSISGRLDHGISYEQHILSAVSDHYYLTYFMLPILLLSCFSFLEDYGIPVISRFHSYHAYFLGKWLGTWAAAFLLTAVQTTAILLSGMGLPLGSMGPSCRGGGDRVNFHAAADFSCPCAGFPCKHALSVCGKLADIRNLYVDRALCREERGCSYHFRPLYALGCMAQASGCSEPALYGIWSLTDPAPQSGRTLSLCSHRGYLPAPSPGRHPFAAVLVARTAAHSASGPRHGCVLCS